MTPEGRERNCLSWWFPRILAAGLPVPRTRILKAPEALEADLGSWRRSDPTPWSLVTLADAIRDVAHEVGGFPLFLRTGFGSGKHEWSRTCHVAKSNSVERHVYALFEWSNMVDLLGLPCDTWVVRELMPVKAAFTAFDGFPVAKERRWFVKDGEVVRWHPYWPPGALEGHVETEGWREALAEANRPDPGEVEELRGLALRASRACPGEWSVDFLHVEGRGWVLIDMADARRSWTWEGWEPEVTP